MPAAIDPPGGAGADPRTDTRAATPRWRSVLHVVARVVLGGLFVYAGGIKVLDRQAMVLAIDAYELIPQALIPALAVIIPWLELVLGVALILGVSVRAAAIAGAVVTTGFLIGMAQAKARGLKIDCGCFTSGGEGEGVTWLDLLRDALILVGFMWLALRPDGPAQIEGRLRTRSARRPRKRHDDEVEEGEALAPQGE